MNLKVGDKVKFLNTTGGGVISKVIDTRMVSVAVEGGFEIPTLVSELIRLDKTDAGGRFFNETFAVTVGAEQESRAPVSDEKTGLLSMDVVKSRKTEEVLLAFVPHDQRWLITGLVDVYLVNNSAFDVIYNFFKNDPESGFSGVDYGSVFSDSKLLLRTIEREELPDWTEGTIQFLFHKEKVPAVIPPFNAEFRIQGKKFYSEGNYRESRFIEGRGIVVKLVSVTEFIQGNPGEKSSPVPGKAAGAGPSDLFILKHRVSDREAVVDLHITELVDDSVKFEKTEILEFQKNYFQRCMESALVNHFLKVTFIHGIGNGVLREVILDDLLKNYKGTDIFDAPMQDYGMGAIEVRIPHNQ
jgi:hypothetical protein